MTTIMNDSHIVSIPQIRKFIKVAEGITFKGDSREKTYKWIEGVLSKFRYFSLKKKDKTIVKSYIMKMTGYSDAQTTRLISKKKKVGRIVAYTTKRNTFPKIYTTDDTALLIETDKAHERLSGPATKRVFKREYEKFGNKEYKNLKDISVSHIYNLRNTRQYKSSVLFFEKTRPSVTPIGKREKPEPKGNPGYIRVDTVHQGDREKEKGVYHINLIDEVTQWELVFATEKISESYLEPILEDALQAFPFKIINFHSDNGSEYINKIVARLLNKLMIGHTKSRARRCSDNALVEGKNGSVIRKHMGRNFIPQRYAPLINKFYKSHMNVYLNFHRPCGFASLKKDKYGKVRKVYMEKDYSTPYEKIKSLPNSKKYLKEGVTFKKLDIVAKRESDTECAIRMKEAKVELFNKFYQEELRLPTIYSYAVSGS
jgi:transposase InsO family protein